MSCVIMETHDKIVAEVRDLSRCIRNKVVSGEYPYASMPTAFGKPLDVYFAELADRIEATAKWEADALYAQIDYYRQLQPKPNPDWEAICEKCHDGEEPPDCEYFGEPNGCNSPIYGEYPKTSGGDPSILRSALVNILLEMEDMCGIENGCKYKFSPDAIAQQCRDALALFTKPAENENSDDAIITPVNNAACRNALEKAMSFFDRGVICTSYANSASEMDELERWYNDIKAALAAPARNCEVGTAEEQAKRLSEWCNGRHCVNCRFKGGWPDECKLQWAQMPYTESEVSHGNA